MPRIVSYTELKPRFGIRWTRKHIIELVRAGRFPHRFIWAAASVAAHFMSAPVSRGEAGHSIELELSLSQIRLTPAQREIANLPGGPGEVEYAKQLLRMQKMQKSGLLK